MLLKVPNVIRMIALFAQHNDFAGTSREDEM